MLSRALLALAASLFVSASWAAEAGKIVFVAGAARIADKAAALGNPVQEGDLLTTGADGYIYVKTIDNGLFILRPSTKARIAVYHVDPDKPENNRFKLELLSGIARSRSGDAVKLARQNFRFNTPVAAIGVRGTDFTVFTDQDTSRVAVVSGAIVVSGFMGACRPEGGGPCEGNAVRELSSAQKGHLLQIQRGKDVPQLLQGGALAPDVLAPPRADEPIGKNSGSTNSNLVSQGEPTLDPKKNATLQGQLVQIVPPATNVATPPAVVAPPADTAPPVVTPPADTSPPVVVTPIVPVAPVVPVLPAREVSWGRWQPVYDRDANSALAKDGSEMIAFNETYVLFRSLTGSAYVLPLQGSAGFAMQSGEAYVRDTTTQVKTAASMENGKLMVDFGKATFSTSLDVLDLGKRFNMQTAGYVTKDGLFYSTNQYQPTNNMQVTGALSGEGSASYIFQGMLSEKRIVSGATVWSKQ